MGETRLHTVGEVTLNYRIDGDGGEPLVCIHGVGSYLEAWSGVVERLKDRFTILTFDLRGHGRSSRVKGRYEIDDFVAETLALADKAGFPTFNLAGFSLGICRVCAGSCCCPRLRAAHRRSGNGFSPASQPLRQERRRITTRRRSPAG